MNWNDAAEDLFQSILSGTPRPIRDQTAENLRSTAEGLAEEEGKNRVGVQTVVEAWVKITPETLRSDIPRQMELFGLDASEYEYLFE
ncbi:MAG: PCP reductase family protein [Acidobacteria bacterium]|nr:PCP reductase family protein [Acidobacteriota bacterium]